MKVILTKNSKIQGLLTKDLIQLKRYRRLFISFIIVFVVIATLQYINTGNSSLICLFPIITTIGSGVFALSSFTYDDIAKTDRYIRSMPIASKDIISSKYIFVIYLTILGSLIGFLIASVVLKIFSGLLLTVDYLNILLITLTTVFCVCIVEAIQIPYIYKFGAEKARMQIYSTIVILIVILTLLVGGIFYWLEKLSFSRIGIESFSPIIITTLIALAYNISYKVSCKIYAKQE